MSNVWAVVIAALGASAITGLASFGVASWSSRQAAKAVLEAQKREAYLGVMTSSVRVMSRAWSLSLAMTVRSGVGEGVDIALYHRKPLDPLDLHTWFSQDFDALHDSAGRVWLHGSQEASQLTDDILLQCASLLELATSLPPHRSWIDRLRRIRRDSEFEQRWLGEVRTLGKLRAQLATQARRELGCDLIALGSWPFPEQAMVRPDGEPSPKSDPSDPHALL